MNEIAEIKPDRDKADGGMPIAKLETLVEDIRVQPQWRPDADLAARYYDGMQLTAERISEMERNGQPVSQTNLIARAINSALGMEAKARLDWKLTSDDDTFADVAAAVGARLTEAQRETMADMAISDAYKDQLVPGLGWVEVSRSPDPWEYPYRVQHVHRNEIWWDWRARRKDLSDAKWLVRQRWVDLEDAITAMPEHKQVLEWCLGDGPLTDALRTLQQFDSLEDLRNVRTTFRVPRDEWWDTERKRVRMYEVWYRVPIQDVVLISNADDRRVRFDKKNPLHREAVTRGLARLVKGPTYQMRQAIFCGPYRLLDVEAQQRTFPYIPFWCYREDQDRTPYGLALGMISPQDEYNERRSKLLWLLRSAQVFVDDDALNPKYNNFLDLAREVMRPDSVFILNKERKRDPGVVVNHNLELSRQQFDAMVDAKSLLTEQPGLSLALLGDKVPGVTANSAMNTLVEQSLVALGETNDNYRMGRRWVGEALVQLIVEDMNRPNMQVRVGVGRRGRIVTLNTADQQGMPVNVVAAAPLKTGLQDVPSTPAHRMQVQNNLAQMMATCGNDPDAYSLLLIAFIQASDIEDKEQLVAWLRKKKGIPDPSEGDGAMAQEEQRLAQVQAQVAAMQQQLAQAELDLKHAQAAKAATDAELNEAKRQQILVETDIAQRGAANPDDAINASIDEARQAVAA